MHQPCRGGCEKFSRMGIDQTDGWTACLKCRHEKLDTKVSHEKKFDLKHVSREKFDEFNSKIELKKDEFGSELMSTKKLVRIET